MFACAISGSFGSVPGARSAMTQEIGARAPAPLLAVAKIGWVWLEGLRADVVGRGEVIFGTRPHPFSRFASSLAGLALAAIPAVALRRKRRRQRLTARLASSPKISNQPPRATSSPQRACSSSTSASKLRRAAARTAQSARSPRTLSNCALTRASTSLRIGASHCGATCRFSPRTRSTPAIQMPTLSMASATQTSRRRSFMRSTRAGRQALAPASSCRPETTISDRASGRSCRSSAHATRCRTSAGECISNLCCAMMSALPAIRRGDPSAIFSLRRRSTSPSPTAGFSRSIQSPDIRWNFGPAVTGQTGRLFLPFDARVGRKFTKTLTVSLEVGVPIINQYPVYDFKTEFRVDMKF